MAGSEDKKSGKSALIFLLIPALIAIGGGIGLGYYLGDLKKSDGAPSHDRQAEAQGASADSTGAKGAHGGHESGHGGSGDSHGKTKSDEAPVKLTLKPMPAIVGNLATPPTALIRIQSSILYDVAKLQNPDIFISELSSDILAFLKTLSISSIQGAEGLRQLNEDLTDRAAIRSNHAVREVIIESMVIQ